MSFGVDISFREAIVEDLPILVALFADDPVGDHNDTTDVMAFPAYENAFSAIQDSANDRIFVGVLNGEVVATAQITFITSLTGRGSTRMMIEAVQTRADMRGKGIGRLLITHCLQVGRQHGADSAQLTSNNQRQDAHRFYERLGFEKSHSGFKLKLKAGPAST
ncbi:GNAT family N-acetyltransferase [Phyllobacterium sp. K27]